MPSFVGWASLSRLGRGRARDSTIVCKIELVSIALSYTDERSAYTKIE